MNRPPISELLDKNIKSLPEGAQKILTEEAPFIIVDKLVNTLNLAPFERDQLIEEITYTLFGYTKIEDFKKTIGDLLYLDDDSATYIDNVCRESFFNTLNKETNDTILRDKNLSHVDILNEIENPTPSIQNKAETNTEEALSVTPASNIMPQGKETNLTTEAPSLAEAIGSIPNIGGFKPIDTGAHPAETVAQKLKGNLSEATSSPVKEIYHVKPLDPYHEPIE